MKLNLTPVLMAAAAVIFTTNSLMAATVFTTTLSPNNEVPPVASTATGSTTVTLNADMLKIDISFTGLTSTSVAAHIHCCGPVGVNEAVALPFTGFPSATSGTYSAMFDLTSSSSYTAAFLTFAGGTAALAESTLIAGLNAGQTYANIHTTINPGGEIRGQLAPVPEPATFLLGGTALLALALGRRKLLQSTR